MPVISRMLSVILRIGEIGFAAVVAGIVGDYLAAFDAADAWPHGRWIYTEVLAGLSMLFGLLWLIPFAIGFVSWPLDIIIALAWFASFGILIDALEDLNCGDPWEWDRFTSGALCDRWQAATAFAFLSAIFWLFSAIVGLWFIYRVGNRAVAGDAAYQTRRPWFRRHHV